MVFLLEAIPTFQAMLCQPDNRLLDPEVPYLDAPWLGPREVYRARVRITMRALSSTPYILSQLLAGRRYGAILLYASHKLLRWLL
jgi:hypothetical protein